MTYDYAYAVQPGEAGDLIVRQPSDLKDLRRQVAWKFQRICLSAIDQKIRSLPVKQRLRVGFCFVERDRPGAFSVNNRERPMICVHDVVIPLIYVFFQRMLQQHGRAISQASIATRAYQPLFDRNFESLWEEAYPAREPEARRIVLLWDRIALTLLYITYHELTHILRRHSEFLPVTNKNEALIAKNDARIFHMVEFDSDRFAMEFLLSKCRDTLNTPIAKRTKADRMRISLYENPAEHPRVLFLSIFLAYRPFYGMQPDRTGYLQRRHPPVASRFMMAIANIYTALLIIRAPQQLRNLFDQQLKWPEFEMIYCGLMGEKLDQDQSEFAISPLMRRYVDRLIKDYIKFADGLPAIGDS